MTRKSLSRLAKDGHIPTPRSLNPMEVEELHNLHRFVAMERFKAEQVKANTALFNTATRSGKEIAQELEMMASYLETFKQNWVNTKIAECGWPTGAKVGIDIKTGIISIH
jgi:hypothetical protein